MPVHEKAPTCEHHALGSPFPKDKGNTVSPRELPWRSSIGKDSQKLKRAPPLWYCSLIGEGYCLKELSFNHLFFRLSSHILVQEIRLCCCQNWQTQAKGGCYSAYNLASGLGQLAVALQGRDKSQETRYVILPPSRTVGLVRSPRFTGSVCTHSSSECLARDID